MRMCWEKVGREWGESEKRVLREWVESRDIVGIELVESGESLKR